MTLITGIRSLVNRALQTGPSVLRNASINAYGELLKRRRFGGEFSEVYAWLERTEALSEGEMKRWQIDRLRATLISAGDTVEYYSDLFRGAHFDPRTAALPDDLRRLPVLTKDDIRRNAHRLRSSSARVNRVVRHSSSGTTGQKLEFLLPKRLLYTLNTAIMWRQYGWAGVRFGDKRVTLTGRDFVRKPPYWVYNRAEKQLLLSVHCLTTATADRYLEAITQFAPVFLQGNVSGIAFLAQRLLTRNARIPLKAVFTTGETLVADQRAVIEEAFKTRVLESYGLGESVVAAQQCERLEGFHEISELGYIELTGAGSADQAGQMVIGTSLWNDAMPFIRYQIEDFVEPSRNTVCSCGRKLPLVFSRVIGRTDDNIEDAQGHLVFSVTVRMCMKPELDPFENYQLQQVGPRRYKLVLTGEPRHEKEDRVRKALASALGVGAVIAVAYEDSLYTTGGKVRNVVSVPNGVQS